MEKKNVGIQLGLLALLQPLPLYADGKDDKDIEHISIIGSREQSLQQPGSAYVIDEEDLKQLSVQ